MKKNILFLIIFLNVLSIHAQHWTKYNTANTSKTICDNNIYCLTIDKLGNKWIGTRSGISKFDGTNWTTYTTDDGLPDNDIFGLFMDKNGFIWAATNKKLSKFNGTSWQSIDAPINWSQRHFVFDDNNSIIIEPSFSEGQLYKYDGIAWDTLVIPNYNYFNGENQTNRSSDIKIDKTGKIWIATKNGIFVLNGTTWKQYTILDGLTSNNVQNILIDNQNNKWFATDAGLSMYNGFTWYNFLPTKDIQSIALDSNNSVWVGSIDSLFCFKNNSWNKYKVSSDDIISNISIDNNGNKWYSSSSSGIFKFNNSNTTNYKITDGLISNQFSCLKIDHSGNKWAGLYDNGIVKFNGNKWTNYTVNDGLADNNVNCIDVDKYDNIWVGTSKGLSKYNGINWETYNKNNGLISDTIKCIGINENGDVWVGTNVGISKFASNQWINYTALDSLKKEVSQICIYKNDAWIGKFDGVSKFDGYNWTSHKIGGIHSLNIDNEGNVWAGVCTIGVMKFDGNIWTTYTIKEGLKSPEVFSILIDNKNNKWFGFMGEMGIQKYNDSVFTNYIQPYAHYDSYFLNQDAQNNIWFTTSYSGIYKLSFDNSGINNLSNDKSNSLKNGELHSYPNPGKDFFYINLPNNSVRYILRLFNQQGTLIKEIDNIQGDYTLIPTNELISGLFFVSLVNKTTNEVSYAKIQIVR